MKCNKKSKALLYLFDQLEKSEYDIYKKHMESCAACQLFLYELQQTQKIMQSRSYPEIPEDLIKTSIRLVRDESKSKKNPLLFKTKKKRFIPFLRPSWQMAVLFLVFLIGFGIGKIGLSPVAWRNSFYLISQSHGNRRNAAVLQDYLLGVETLFLDLSNREKNLLIEEEEIRKEILLTHDALKKTKKIKKIIKDKDTQLFQLILEIEWVLEEILFSVQQDKNNFSKDAREKLEEYPLLVKIYHYTSSIKEQLRKGGFGDV
jgi:hypothetical protein